MSTYSNKRPASLVDSLDKARAPSTSQPDDGHRQRRNGYGVNGADRRSDRRSLFRSMDGASTNAQRSREQVHHGRREDDIRSGSNAGISAADAVKGMLSYVPTVD